jgi:EAL domain-containing protein (putative c-di-GMP-specific phosphodiesterase class I)
MRINASIGIATAPPSSTITADELLRDADTAMYAAKSKDVHIEVFDERLKRRTHARANHEQELARALDGSELALLFQPFVTLAPGDPSTMEFEALVRWRHPEHGLLHPAGFVPFAEESGMITALDDWVLRRACQDAATVLGDDATVWANISLASLSRPQIVEHIQACLAEAGVAPTSLGLELTERALGEGGAQMRQSARRLRELGIKLAVDDFGAGYSSLSSVIERPVDRLKIDRSLTASLPDRRSVAVIRAIVAMAASLELDTIAEGVEERAQLAALRELGCDRGQGFLLAEPMDLVQLTEHYERVRGQTGCAPAGDGLTS